MAMTIESVDPGRVLLAKDAKRPTPVKLAAKMAHDQEAFECLKND
jgi:hypothetical protein